MKKSYKIFMLFLVTLCVTTLNVFSGNWENFNSGWKFIKGNPEKAETVDFNDNTWEKVSIPHDWAITGPFNENENGSTGKLPWKGEGWYRKSFTVKTEDQGKVAYIKFDGVMASPQIYINGKLAGKWDYGYSTFYVDITDFLDFGKENIIAVHVDTRNHGSRWYPGA